MSHGRRVAVTELLSYRSLRVAILAIARRAPSLEMSRTREKNFFSCLSNSFPRFCTNQCPLTFLNFFQPRLHPLAVKCQLCHAETET